MDLELIMRYEYEKYITICLAFLGFFPGIVWLYIQMSIWQPCIHACIVTSMFEEAFRIPHTHTHTQ
jgi:hypothetical protein